MKFEVTPLVLTPFVPFRLSSLLLRLLLSILLLLSYYFYYYYYYYYYYSSLNAVHPTRLPEGAAEADARLRPRHLRQ